MMRLFILALLVIAACTVEIPSEPAVTESIEADLAVNEEAVENGAVLAGTASPYLEFTQESYQKALDDGKVIVLYFYADWCPLCKVEQKHTFAAFDELDNEKVIGFRVNYRDSDTDKNEEALAKQFGITYQHTKVILKDGKQILKAPDSWDKQRYLDEIMKVAP